MHCLDVQTHHSGRRRSTYPYLLVQAVSAIQKFWEGHMLCKHTSRVGIWSLIFLFSHGSIAEWIQWVRRRRSSHLQEQVIQWPWGCNIWYNKHSRAEKTVPSNQNMWDWVTRPKMVIKRKRSNHLIVEAFPDVQAHSLYDIQYIWHWETLIQALIVPQ